jgi:hypothetical protein
VHGSGSLVRWLFDNHLVDEITLLTYAVVVGQGTRLFLDTGPDTALELVDSRATPKGVTIQVYRPVGRPPYATATTDRSLGQQFPAPPTLRMAKTGTPAPLSASMSRWIVLTDTQNSAASSAALARPCDCSRTMIRRRRSDRIVQPFQE